MHDDRIALRAVFDLVNLAHGGGVPGVGREAIDRFGGQGDDLPRLEQLRRARHRLREQPGSVRRQYNRVHVGWQLIVVRVAGRLFLFLLVRFLFFLFLRALALMGAAVDRVVRNIS